MAIRKTHEQFLVELEQRNKNVPDYTIRELGYNLVVIWENDYNKMIKQ